MKTRLDQLLSSLGYGSRKDIKTMVRNGWVDVAGVTIGDPGMKVEHADVRVDDEPLDPPHGLILAMNKPLGVVCSHRDSGKLIYSLLPERWQRRNPPLSTVGRLDRDTSGIILLTDDGQLIHELTSPRKKVEKVYDVTLADPLHGDEGIVFASGTLMLDGEDDPCLPADLEIIDATHVRLTLTEGRYHQVRRMFAATGNRVTALERSRFGKVTLEKIAAGEYRIMKKEEIV